jgi:hypothetical protein
MSSQKKINPNVWKGLIIVAIISTVIVIAVILVAGVVALKLATPTLTLVQTGSSTLQGYVTFDVNISLAVKDVQGYVVEISSTSNFEKPRQIKSTSAIVPLTDVSGTNYFRCFWQHKTKDDSPKSKVVKYEMAKPLAALKVTSVTAATKTLIVDFTPVSGASSYIFFYQSPGKTILIKETVTSGALGGSSSYTISGLESGFKYNVESGYINSSGQISQTAVNSGVPI